MIPLGPIAAAHEDLRPSHPAARPETLAVTTVEGSEP